MNPWHRIKGHVGRMADRARFRRLFLDAGVQPPRIDGFVIAILNVLQPSPTYR